MPKEEYRKTVAEAIDHIQLLLLGKIREERIEAFAKRLSKSGELSFNCDRFIGPDVVLPIEIIIRKKRKATATEIRENKSAA